MGYLSELEMRLWEEGLEKEKLELKEKKLELKQRAELMEASKGMKRALDSLIEQGFTREEAMDIIKIGLRGAM